MATMAGHMASLCEHLESTNTFFQVSLAGSVGGAWHSLTPVVCESHLCLTVCPFLLTGTAGTE